MPVRSFRDAHAGRGARQDRAGRCAGAPTAVSTRGDGLPQFNDDTWGDYVQDEYEVPTIFDIEDKWNKIRDHLATTAEADSGEMYLNFSSGSSPVAVPDAVACGAAFETRGVNDYALEYLGDAGDRTGVFMMDFPNTGLVESIIAWYG